jgi:FMN phosphatase YigB (HAD superfamily)
MTLENDLSQIKAIFFDYGWTLNNPDLEALFPEVIQVLEQLKPKYKLALISLAKSQDTNERRETIKARGLEPFFNYILIGQEDKDEMYEQVLNELNLLPQQVAIVDDRVIRGITWGNKREATTIWLKRPEGKWSHQEPSEESGAPDFIIEDLIGLIPILG